LKLAQQHRTILRTLNREKQASFGKERLYAGQIIGINTRSDDMEINVVREKQLTNMRSKSSDGTVQLTPPIDMSL